MWVRFAPTREGTIDGLLGVYTADLNVSGWAYFSATGVAAPVAATGATGATGETGGRTGTGGR